MPELPEIKIMSDFINSKSDKNFIKAFDVQKGNIPILFDASFNLKNFTIKSESFGKELILIFSTNLKVYFFMGMSGNWKYVKIKDWEDTKFTRFRIDDDTGYSLICYGGFMGPKYSVGKKFGGIKRGPDPTLEFDIFRQNILDSIDKNDFDKPICEVLLNQKYFNGIGNYLRCHILNELDQNPFECARDSIKKYPKVLELCYDVPIKSYQFGGGQLKDWENPFVKDSFEFREWVFYKKGLSCRDGVGRTFWFDKKWEDNCPYKIKNRKNEQVG